MTSTLRNPRVLFVLRGYPLGGKRTSDATATGSCERWTLFSKEKGSCLSEYRRPRLVLASTGPSASVIIRRVTLPPTRPHLHLRGYLIFVLVFYLRVQENDLSFHFLLIKNRSTTGDATVPIPEGHRYCGAD